MSSDNETPEQRRERLRQKELKKPSSSIHGSNLADLAGGLGWKGTGIIILILIIGLIIYSVFSLSWRTFKLGNQRQIIFKNSSDFYNIIINKRAYNVI